MPRAGPTCRGLAMLDRVRAHPPPFPAAAGTVSNNCSLRAKMAAAVLRLSLTVALLACGAAWTVKSSATFVDHLAGSFTLRPVRRHLAMVALTMAWLPLTRGFSTGGGDPGRQGSPVSQPCDAI